MERTERILDLVALFLDAQEPIPLSRLREMFPEDYGQGTPESAERKFERDKAELLELGIPITFLQAHEDVPDGYVVDRSQYYLPDAGLSPEEVAVLYAAGSAALASGAFPGRQDLSHALRKIGFLAGGELPTPRVRLEQGDLPDARELPMRLEGLWAAAASRKYVDLTYYSPRADVVTERRVEPWGLALRRGLWSLVGYCHLRKNLRTFYVHRIRQLTVNTHKPKTPDFEVPADFKIESHVASYPWQHSFHPPMAVGLRLNRELAPLAASLFLGATCRLEGAEARVTVEATHLEGLLQYSLSLGTDCQVESPPEAVAAHKAMARRVLEAHGGQA